MAMIDAPTQFYGPGNDIAPDVVRQHEHTELRTRQGVSFFFLLVLEDLRRDATDCDRRDKEWSL